MQISKFGLRVILVSIFMVTLSACGDGPSEVAEEFIVSIYENDFDRASQYATPDTIRTYKSMRGLINLSKRLGGESESFCFELVSETINGDTATVNFRNEDATEERLVTVKLKKIDGDWKVHETK